MKWFPLCTRKTNEQRKKQTRKKWWDIHSHASHLHGQLIYDQGTKSLQCGKNSFLNKKCWENWMATCKKKRWNWIIITHTKWQNGLKTPRGTGGWPEDRCMNISERSCLHYDLQDELLWAGALETDQVWMWTSFQGQSSRGCWRRWWRGEVGRAPNKARGAGRFCRAFYSTVKTVDFILVETEVSKTVTEERQDQVQHSGWSVEDEQGGLAAKGQLGPQLTPTKECFHILFR